MKKKDAIQKGIDNIPYYEPELDYGEKQKIELEKKKDDARPALLKRMAASVLDFIFAVALAGGLFALSYFTILPSVGYQDSAQFMMDTYSSSYLYLPKTNGPGYDPLTSRYNDELTPEKNYDEPITKFYTTNSRAVEDNKNQEYIDRKIESNYYYINELGECVRKDGIANATVKEYLEKEYSRAVNYLFQDPAVIKASKILSYSIPITILIVVSISCSIFYFAVPLIDEKRRTFGYMICKIMPVRSDTLVTPDRSRIALRSLIFVTVNYLSLITIGLFLGGTSYAFIPFFINTVILCFSHSNSGIHDYGTKICVINESMSNAMAALKQVTGGDN